MEKKILILLVTFTLVTVFSSLQVTAQICPPEPPSYPLIAWDRVWCDSVYGIKIADFPDEVSEQFDNNWGLGEIIPGYSDRIGFRSGRMIYLPAGEYEFTLGSDDGSRLWIDGELVIDNWGDHWYTEKSFRKTFTSDGYHRFRIDYYESWLDARVRFSYRLLRSMTTTTPTTTFTTTSTTTTTRFTTTPFTTTTRPSCPAGTTCVDIGICRYAGGSCVSSCGSYECCCSIPTTYTTTTTRTTTSTTTTPTTTFTTTPTTTSTTIPQCDSSSYTTCSNAYTFTTSDSKSNMCGNEQYYKISTPEGKKCDIEWKVIPDSQSDYDLYVKWDSNCPSRTNYDCSSTLALGVTDTCSKRDFSGTTYAMVRKFSGISYRIEVSVTNCKDITTSTTTSTTTTLPQDDPCDNSGTWRKYYPYCCEGDCSQDSSKIRGFCLDKGRYQTYIQDLELIREGSTENCVKCKNEKCCHEIRGFCYDYDSSSPTGCRSPPQGIITRACGDAGGNTCDILSNLQGCGLRESSSKLGPVYCASCVPTTPPITTTFTTTSTITTTLTTTSTTTPQATTTLTTTLTTTSIPTTPTSTTTQVPTTTTIPTIPNLLVSHSDCYVNSLCTSEIVSSCDQPMWILLNSEGRPLDYTREFPIRYEIKTNYTPTSTGKIKAMAICFSSPEYPHPRVNTSFVEVKPRMIDCPTNCELNSQCSCTITGCNLGVVIVTIDGRVLNVDYVTSSPFTTRFVPNEIKTVNVTLYCVNPPLTSRAQIGITSTTTSTTTTTTTTTIPSTWLNGWQYRKPITINNPSSDLSNYQVLVNLNTESLISSGKMRSDCGDIRFTDSDGLTQLNYWLESGCNSDNTRIWVKVPYIPARSTKTIYVYYGNPSATSLSNGINTFLAFSLKFDGPFGGRTSLGAAHTCALLADGTAKCWGNNYDGQLGDGTNTNKNTPVTVSGLTNAVAIAGGAAHTCALLSDGTAKCWGNNYYGQLGDGTFIDKNTPVTVSGLTNAVAIAASFYHTCALLSDGTAKCWGRNDYGQLGDGTNTNKNTPVTVSGLTNAVAIAAGGYHTCALLADGTAKCWGYNGNGQLGDGTFIDKNTPVTVSGLTNAVAIAGGAAHTCALLSDGTAKCWGNNAEGQLGDGGTFIEKTTPVTVSGLTNAVAIAAGSSHTCALLSDGTVKCWGRNDYGQLGDGTFIDKNTPVTVSGLTNAVAIAASDVHTCALLSDGTAKCWGNNYDGQLGDGTFTPTAPYGKSTPVAVSNYNLGGRYDKTNGIPATIQKPPYFQDIYFIRKYTSPELTTSVRDEETLPIPATTSTTTPTTPTTLPYTTTTPLTPASTTSSTTTPTTTPHTTTTLTTTSIKEFKVREFNCVKSGNSYSCMIFYENNYGRNVYLVFFVSDTEGRTVTNSNIYTLQPGSGSTPSYTFSCSGRTGDYYIYWIVYEDSSLKNPKWWPPTNEWKRVTC
jgi:alpha-tubulin suppressor-like RCC1 family protein